MNEQKPEKHILNSDEVKSFVDEANEKIFNILYKETEHIRDKQRWLIIGRCINFFISKHYAPVFFHAVKENFNESPAASGDEVGK
jgi:hypothetical protein